MKRRTMHLIFGAAALACAGILAIQALRLRAAEGVNAAIAAAPVTDSEGGPPEARFARAAALAGAGETDAAAKVYKALTQGTRDDLRRAALYNLGNLYLREATKNGNEEAVRAMPLIELAKQAYRELLRADPGDWDARYNLERALWLAPEFDDTALDDEPPPVAPERAITTMQGERMELP